MSESDSKVATTWAKLKKLNVEVKMPKRGGAKAKATKAEPAAVKALVLTSMFVPGPLTEDLRRLIRQRRRRGEASRTRADQCQLSCSGCVLICSLGLSTPGVTS